MALESSFLGLYQISIATQTHRSQRIRTQFDRSLVLACMATCLKTVTFLNFVQFLCFPILLVSAFSSPGAVSSDLANFLRKLLHGLRSWPTGVRGAPVDAFFVKSEDSASRDEHVEN